MKNSNDPITFTGKDSCFANLPTAAEAEQMEAAAPEAVTFSETAVTNLALAKLQDEQTVKAAHAPGKRRRSFRVAMVAACIAVFLLGTAGAVAKIGFDFRFTDLLGMKGMSKELEESWYEIGTTKTISDVEVTIVDAFGDSNNQWAELKTNLKFTESVPDGFVTSDTIRFPAQLHIPHINFENPDSDVIYFNLGTICTPFARDGYLWYLLYFNSKENPINNGIFTFKFDMYVSGVDAVIPFELKWKSQYDSREEVITVNRPLGDKTITSVHITPTSLTVYAEGPVSDGITFRIDSITLADGTVYAAKEKFFYGFPGGVQVNDSTFRACASYLFLPNHSFDTPADMTSMIPADEVVAITVDGVTIPIR